MVKKNNIHSPIYEIIYNEPTKESASKKVQAMVHDFYTFEI